MCMCIREVKNQGHALFKGLTIQCYTCRAPKIKAQKQGWPNAMIRRFSAYLSKKQGWPIQESEIFCHSCMQNNIS